MAELTPGLEIPGTGWHLVTPVASDTWGEIWRANGPDEKKGIAVVYTTEEGEQMFLEALPQLRRWRDIAASGMCPVLLPILAIVEESSWPAVIAQDPGGRTLREFATPEPPEERGSVAVMAGIAKGINGARAYDLPLVGLSPDTIVEAPGFPDAPWRLLPVCPGATNAYMKAWGGRYAAPELSEPGKLSELCPDVYTLSWLLAEMCTGTAAHARNPAEALSQMRLPRLRTVLGNGLRPLRGKYPEPALVHAGLERWLKHEADDDYADVRAKHAASQRAPWLNWVHERKRPLTQAGVGLGILLVLVLLVLAVPMMIRAPVSDKNAHGLVDLFFGAMIERDTNTARVYTTGEATPQVERLMADIQRMEDTNLASRFASATKRIQGSGEARNVKSNLFGENRDMFMEVEMTIRKTPEGPWRVEKLFFQPTRQPED